MSNKYLDSQGVQVLWGLIKEEISKTVTVNSTSIWDKKSSYIPVPGEIIVYSDYKVIDNQDVPGIKIGNGRTPVSELKFINSITAERVEHSLTIGDYTYDGSEEVIVPVYIGEIIN